MVLTQELTMKCHEEHYMIQGFAFAGAQYADQCFCGNSYGKYGPSTSCDMQCTGDQRPDTFCGGSWANTVIATGLGK